mgnify:CR=1 FL=1
MRVEAIIALLGLGITVTACQSLPATMSSNAAPPAVEANTPAVATSLGPQSMRSGECGVFLWRAVGQHDLLVFENLTRGEIAFLVDGETLRWRSPVVEGAIPAGDPYERTFPGSGATSEVRVSGRFDETAPDGLRMNRAVLRLEGADGRRTVIPVLGHYACRQD